MDLQNIQEVKVDPRGGYKYIVAVISDPNGNQKTVVRADANCTLHKHIVNNLWREVWEIPQVNVDCIGGGRISVNPDQKTICIWDWSGDFGKEPDRQQTVRILQAAFPDFTVTAN